ncbi:MAG: tRNA lysidine(34) synthetase TilS [FCB group bacterium]|nr:tRNA lysidine(34) synthetase TilS [FCB group bacterium]
MPQRVVAAKLLSFAQADGISLDAVKILLAVSGGIDSMVMLDIFLKLKDDLGFRPALAHVDHGLRPDSNLDYELCRQAADKAGIPFYSRRLAASERKGSVEAWARRERYAFLITTAKVEGFQWIMTAHHQDDQLETVYMRQREQAHWSALVGIRECIGRVRRPMLEVTRAEIESYARSRSVIWHEDSSNRDIRFRRNQVRLHELPGALASDATLKEALLALSAEANEKFLEIGRKLKLLEPELLVAADFANGEIVLDRSNFLKLNADEKKIFVQSLTSKFEEVAFITATAGHWESFWQYITTSGTGTVFELTKQISCLIDRKWLILFNRKKFTETRRVRITLAETRWFDGKLTLQSADTPAVSEDKKFLLITKPVFEAGLFIRGWKRGDRILTHSLKKSVKLSDLFINHKLSHLEKLKQPVVVNKEDKILWVPGVAHSLLTDSGIQQKGDLIKLKWQKKKKKN